LKKVLTYLICTVIVFLVGAPDGHARGLESRATGNQLYESKPKNVITAAFEVTNTTDQRIECMPDIKLPPGWKPITSLNSIWLERNQTSVFLVSFYVPDNALAKSYDIECIFTSTRDPSISTHQSITVRVLSITGLKVHLIDSPRSVISGQEYVASFLVTNESNQEQNITLQISSSSDFPFSMDAHEFSLGPRGAQTVHVTVQTHEVMNAGLTHKIECTALVIGKEEIHAQAQALVEVITLGGQKDIYHTVPTTLSIRQSLEKKGKTTNTPFQAEVQGEGTLDEAGTKYISFLFRGPDTLENSLSGSRDNYTLQTWGETYDLTAGDAQFSLSELTEQYLTARGVDGLIAYKGMNLRSYYAKSQWMDPQITETAATFGYAATDRARFSVSCLNKDKEDLVGTDKLLTATVDLKPIQFLNIQIEGGMGKHLEETDAAYLVKLSYLNDLISSRMKYLYAAPYFPGYYQDKQLFSLDLSGPWTDSVQVNAAFNREKNNLDMDQLQQSAALDTLYQTGLDYRFGPDTTYTTSWQYRSSKDRRDAAAFDYSATTFRAGVIQSFSKLSLNLYGEAGRKNDRVSSQTELIYQASSSMYLTLTNDQTYGGYLRLSQGQNAEVGRDQNLTAGITGSIRITNTTQFQCTGQVDTYSNAAIGNKYMLNSSLNHTFVNKSTLTLQAEHTFSANHEINDDETSVTLEYSYPFDLPVGKKMGSSTVSGIIRDVNTGEALANVLLRIDNMTTATGKDGRFMFSSIRPGVSYLSIDTSRLGFDQIPTCQNPLPIKLEGGQEKILDIDVTKKATLTGRVVLYGIGNDKTTSLYEVDESVVIGSSKEPPPEPKEISGLANVLIELVTTNETSRVLTDSQGRFRFNEVRPGKKTLQVSTDTLPKYYGFDKNNISLEIGPGQTQEIIIKAMPKKRSIQIIEQGDTIIQEKKKKK
jgi:hypothetical protein